MGIQLTVDNRYVSIQGASRRIIRKLERVTSYLVAGFMHSPAFKAKRWDGRDHLMKFNRKRGYRAPVGLLDDITACLDAEVVPYTTKHSARKRVSKPISFDWNTSIELRPYQKLAKRAICHRKRWNKGCGLLKMPTRSGKTKTAAAIMAELSARTLFIVPSQMLLHQTADSLADSLLGAHITKIGDGEWDDEGDIVVTTVQSLAASRGGERTCSGNFDTKAITKEMDEAIELINSRKALSFGKASAKLNPKLEEALVKKLVAVGLEKRALKQALDMVKRIIHGKTNVYTEKPAPCGKAKCKGEHMWKKPATPEYKELCHSFDLVLFDEAHHLRGDSWHGVVMDIHAIYRIGLSATIYLDHDREVERGAIWLKACCGDIVYEIGTSELIEQGWLMRQNVELVPIDKPDNISERRWSKRLQDEAIYLNGYRNAVCALKAREKTDDGMKVLIISRRHAQVNQICQMVDDLGMTVEPVTGKERMRRREELVEGFVGGYTQVLVGTVFGEGVDIPEVEVVINAEGGRDIKSAVQRQRNLTIADGKSDCVFVDMVDFTNEYFALHSAERKEVYCSEDAYVVRVALLDEGLVAEAEGLAERFHMDCD